MKNNLKALREAKGWTITELEKRSGVSRVTIWSIENEKSAVVKTSTLKSLSDALETSIDKIFSEEC